MRQIVAGLSVLTITPPAGESVILSGVETLILTSADSSILMTGANATKTIDLSVLGSAIPIGTFTPGSIIFAGATNLQEDNTNFFWDDTLNEIEIVGSQRITHLASVSDDHALEIDVNSAGFGDVRAIEINYNASTLAATEDEAAILISIDESNTGGGRISALEVLSTNEGSAEVYALEVGATIHPIIQSAGTFGDMDVAERNGVDQLAAFTDTGTDIPIFVANTDKVSIGDIAKFEEIECIFSTFASNPGVKPTFEYSTGSGTWAPFTPTDGTNGCRNNGVISWLVGDIPGWLIGASSMFLIRMTRTQGGLGTVPIESIFQIAAVTEHKWDANGDFSINNIVTAGTIKMTERSAAISDTDGKGQLWVKNTNPCELWFTDDVGNDTQIV